MVYHITMFQFKVHYFWI